MMHGGEGGKYLLIVNYDILYSTNQISVSFIPANMSPNWTEDGPIRLKIAKSCLRLAVDIKRGGLLANPQ